MGITMKLVILIAVYAVLVSASQVKNKPCGKRCFEKLPRKEWCGACLLHKVKPVASVGTPLLGKNETETFTSRMCKCLNFCNWNPTNNDCAQSSSNGDARSFTTD